MKINFLGTRGYITAKTRRHNSHTATMITFRGTRIIVDCGQDWLDKIARYKPDAIIITHAHPDHAWGLAHGAPCPVYATRESWQLMKKYPIDEKTRVLPYKKITIGTMTVEAFPVIHSIRAPAVGYRIAAGKKTIFCSGDLISIKHRHAALHGVNLYIGDGATISRPIIRRKGDILFGHTTIRAQLGWCQKEKVPQAIFTHCGSQIVEGDGRVLGAQVRAMGRLKNVKARIAYDGLEIVL